MSTGITLSHNRSDLYFVFLAVCKKRQSELPLRHSHKKQQSSRCFGFQSFFVFLSFSLVFRFPQKWPEFLLKIKSESWKSKITHQKKTVGKVQNLPIQKNLIVDLWKYVTLNNTRLSDFSKWKSLESPNAKTGISTKFPWKPFRVQFRQFKPICA